MHPLAQRLLSHIRQQDLLHAGERVGVAVSGGIDSAALLRLLLELRGELGIVLSVVHFNHKLRGAESDADEQFVAELARAQDLEFLVDSDDVAGHAREEGVSLETAARELRYGFFRSLIEEGPSGAESRGVSTQDSGGARLDKIVTGHTLDDQAETVLMRLIRGAGLRGLGGIYPMIPVEDDDGQIFGEIVRPLLAIRRCELEQYLRDVRQSWREDTTNADEKFTRNRIRKLVVPLLEKEFNPSVAENLAELADIARGEEDYWENELAGWMGTGVHWSEPEWARAASLVQIELNSSAQDGVQGLKPPSSVALNGAAESRALSRQRPGGAASRALSKQSPGGAESGALSKQELRGSPTSAAEQAFAHDITEEKADLQSRIDSSSWLVMNASVDHLWFLGESVAVQRRVIKAITEQAGIPMGFKHVEEVLRFAAEEGRSGKELSLPLGWKVRRERQELIFVTPDLREGRPQQDYEYELPLPGHAVISETASRFEARRVAAGTQAYNPEHLLDAESLPGPLKVRNWRAGDRFWPAHTKSPKKIKELLQELHVMQPDRGLWPVVVSGDEIVWLRGFPTQARMQPKAGHEAVLIEEVPLGGGHGFENETG